MIQHAFRTVQFRGVVTFLDSAEDKLQAPRLMIDQLESDPEPVTQRFLQPDSVEDVAIGRIDVELCSAKRRAPG